MMAEPAKKVSGNTSPVVGGDGKPPRSLYVLTQIGRERDRQIAKGYDADHDDSHGASTLVHNGYERFRMLGSYPEDSSRRKALLELAAMVVAEIERHDRAVGAKAIEL